MFVQKIKTAFEKIFGTAGAMVSKTKPCLCKIRINSKTQMVEVAESCTCFLNQLHHAIDGHRIRQKTLSVMAPFLAVMLFMCYLFVTAPYGLTADGQKVEEPYVIKAGNIELAVVENKTAAEQVLAQFQKSFLPEGAEILEFKTQPLLSIAKKDMERGGDAVTVLGNTAAVRALCKAADYLYPIFTTELSAQVTKTEIIPYKTKVKKSDEYVVGYKEVVKEGVNGKKVVTYNVEMVNGKVVAKEAVESSTSKKAVTKVVVKGTKEVTASTYAVSASYISTSGKAASGTTGSDVVAYAKQFLGNPYVYGGSSLTNGTDCSGFTMSVYAHFGVSLPHGSTAQRSYGTPVSYSNAQPGDLIFYSGHVAIYMGGGRIIHASTAATGIITGSATYRSIICVRRIL